jgi:peptidoglycan/LPS O-acetylase OafA/YrhL
VTKSFYRPELDWLRFFAFLMVFLHHAVPLEPEFYLERGFSSESVNWILSAAYAGALGVDVFLILSSFLITELLLREWKERGQIDSLSFYARRALRIWPLYYAFLLLAIFLAPALIAGEQLPPAYARSFLFFAGNWICAFRGYPASVAAPLWSVSVEEQFYLFWPLVLSLTGVARLRKLALLLLAFSFGVRMFLVRLSVPHPGIWCNTFARMDPIALGALLAVTLEGRTPALKPLLRGLLAAASLVLFVLSMRYCGLAGPRSLATYPLVAAASTGLLIAFLGTAPSGGARPLSALAYLGKISYGLYVYHFFAIRLFEQKSWFGRSGMMLLAFALTVALAAVSYRWLESPFLRLKKRFTWVPSRPEG